MKFLVFASLLVAISGAPALVKSVYGEHHASYINETASAFIKIIKTNDLRSQDAIYFTPAVVLIGKKNGDILRCLQDDPDECEMFYQAKPQTPVYSLLISGAYVYAGLGSGSILRCELSNKASCRTVYTCGQHVFSLAIVGGYLHAGLENSTIRCALSEPYSCHILHAMEKEVYSLIQSDDHIYAGTGSGKLMRCSLRTENFCNPVSLNILSSIMGSANIENNVLLLTWEGELWNCSRKYELTTDYCVYTSDLSKSDIWDMAAYNGVLYVVTVDGTFICNMTDDTDCSNYGQNTGATSIAIAYSTFHMQSRYKDEHALCKWQSSHRCPPFVTYYEPQERSMLEVHVKDGKLTDYLGDLVDTSNADVGHSGPAAIFAMGPDGTILLSNVHKEGLLHSSSLFAGSPVAGAGEMVVENGVIKKMTTCSQHYKPDLVLNSQVIDSLRYQGYTVPIDSKMCCEDNECGNVLSSNKMLVTLENIQRMEAEENISHGPLKHIHSIESEGNAPPNSIAHESPESIQPMESEGNIPSNNVAPESSESIQSMGSEGNIPSNNVAHESSESIQSMGPEGNIPSNNVAHESPESIQSMGSEGNILSSNISPESIQPMESDGNILPDIVEYEAEENIQPEESEY